MVLCQPHYTAYTLVSSFCLQYILGTLRLTHAAVPPIQQMCDGFLLKVMKNEQKTLTEEVNRVLRHEGWRVVGEMAWHSR